MTYFLLVHEDYKTLTFINDILPLVATIRPSLGIDIFYGGLKLNTVSGAICLQVFYLSLSTLLFSLVMIIKLYCKFTLRVAHKPKACSTYPKHTE